MKRVLLVLLVLVVLLAGACQEDDPDWEGITAASMAEARATEAKAEVKRAEAQIAAAQATQAHAGVNAEYATTMHDAIDGLVAVTRNTQALLAAQTLLPWLVVGAMVVVLVGICVVGVFMLRYQIAVANAQRSMWQTYITRLELESGGARVFLVRPGVRAERLGVGDGRQTLGN